jgi:hypothetical protein
VTITSVRPEQLPVRQALQQRVPLQVQQRQPEQLPVRRWRLRQMRMRRWSQQRQRREQQRQVPVRQQQVPRVRVQELLPSWRKQPAQPPAGKRSGDFFSCTFLLIDQYCLR